MYKNRAASGKNNISGTNIARIRKALHPKVSQRLLSVKMQLEGIELDKNAIQRIECGARFITDIELKAFAKVLNVSYEELLAEWALWRAQDRTVFWTSTPLSRFKVRLPFFNTWVVCRYYMQIDIIAFYIILHHT